MKPIFQLTVIALSFLLNASASYGEQIADKVVVVKNVARLYLMRKENEIASFKVKFGSNPKGHKQQQGDGRTPEGTYILDYKNASSSFYKSIHISYPNANDRANARRLGVSPGGNIMIHGQPNGWGRFSPIIQLFNWTDGCIALSDSDMDRVWKAVEVGTPIEIKP